MSENNTKQTLPDPKIDAIKQIIFGDDLADYNQRFHELNQVVEDLRNDLETKLSDLELKVDSTISELRNDYEKDVNKLENRLDKELNKLENDKLDKKALGKMFHSLGEKLQS